MADDGLEDPVGDQQVSQIVGVAVVGADQPVHVPLGGIDIGVPNAVLPGQLAENNERAAICSGLVSGILISYRDSKM